MPVNAHDGLLSFSGNGVFHITHAVTSCAMARAAGRSRGPAVLWSPVMGDARGTLFTSY
jgi:hypothetical protein